MPDHHAIAIDGPAASGKSTLARLLATRLGLIMVNSGEMYRAVTWSALQSNIDPANADAVNKLLDQLQIDCGDDGLVSTIAINGVIPGEQLRSPQVNANVSAIAAIPHVRERLVALQRAYLERSSVVMEGRDIGSVVFPETPYKIYVHADEAVRNARRVGDGEIDAVAKRDHADRCRTTSPLVRADGAAVLDTSTIDRREMLDAALRILAERGFPVGPANRE